MTFIGLIIFFAFLLMPLGAIINAHKTKVRRRQNIEDMREAMAPRQAEGMKESASPCQAIANDGHPYAMYQGKSKCASGIG